MNTAKKLSIRLEAVGGDKVRQEFNALGADGTKAFGRITQVITPANDNLKALDTTARAFNNVLKQAAGLAGVYLGFRGITSIFRSIVSTNRQFEQLSGSLRTVTGSVQEAKKAFAMIEQFAATTPYQLEEIVDAFIRLKAMGLEPSKEALDSYGNTASAFGKNILDFVGAVASATVGEFERLKTFGIKAQVEGDKVRFIFQGMTTEVGKNSGEIEAYLRNLGKVNFSGAMSEQMKTINGVASNIQDNLSKLARDIGSQGLNEAITNVLSKFNGMIAGASGVAKSIGETLASAVNLAGKAFFFLVQHANEVATVLLARLGSTALLSGVSALSVAFKYLNSVFLGVVASSRAAVAGIVMMSQVSKVAAVQMALTAGVVNTLRMALALIGGPAGLAIVTGYALYKLADSHDIAKRAGRQHADTLNELKQSLADTVKEVGNLSDVSKNEAFATWGKQLQDAEQNIKDLEASLKNTGGISIFQRLKPDFLKKDWEIMADDLQRILSESKIDLEQYQKEVWELAKDYPDFTPMAKSIQENILLLKAARIDAQKARDELNNLKNPPKIDVEIDEKPISRQTDEEIEKIQKLIVSLGEQNVAISRVNEARKNGEEALQRALAQNEYENQVRQIGINLTKEQSSAIQSLVGRKFELEASDRRYQQSLKEQEEAEKKHNESLKDLENRLLDLKSPYEKAIAEANAWKTETLAGLDKTKAGYIEFQADVEKIYADMVQKAQKTALDSSTAWQDGLTRGLQNVYSELSDSGRMAENLVKNSFKAMEDTLVDFVMTGKMNFADFANSIVAEMVRISMQYAVIKPLMGGAMGYLGIPMAHSGGVIGQDNLVSKKVVFDVFSGAPKYHSGGLVGDEIPIIAKRGESVFTKGQMAVLGSELGAKTPVLVNVQVLNKAEGTKATAQSSQDAQGNVSLNIIVEQIESSIGRNIGRGEGLAPLLEQRYALNPALGSYR